MGLRLKPVSWEWIVKTLIKKKNVVVYEGEVCGARFIDSILHLILVDGTIVKVCNRTHYVVCDDNGVYQHEKGTEIPPFIGPRSIPIPDEETEFA